jgi:hypothetical protein
MGLKYPDQHLNRGQTLDRRSLVLVTVLQRRCDYTFPKEEVTPPVTKIYFVWFMLLLFVL